ncbi:MAG: polysaccharide pyruvyl transferase family protein [Alphaproteobacteria bacterium]
MRIAITNQTGSRNRGCDALVEGVMTGLENQGNINVEAIDLHTSDYPFDSWRYQNQDMECYWAYPLREMYRHTPWIPTNKLLYRSLITMEKMLPEKHARFRTFSKAREADCMVTVGGDVFTSDYGTFKRHTSYMHIGKPVFVCAQSMGPLSKKDTEHLKKSTKNILAITARESLTYEWLKSLDLDCPVEQTADVAFLLPTLSREETYDYATKYMNVDLRGKKLAGLSVSELVTKYHKEGREYALNEMAGFVDALNDQGYSVILIPHVAERKFANDDQRACLDVLRRVKRNDMNINLLGWFNGIEAKSVIGLCDVLIGARTHPTIGSLSQGIPTVAIAYSRKAHGIMGDYYGDENGPKLTLSADNFNAKELVKATELALSLGKQEKTANAMKELAQRNFGLLAELLEKKGIK